MKTRGTWLLTLLSAVFIYPQVFALPWVPILTTGDQSIYLHDGTRMLDGQLIYRDYDHFTFPGTDVLYMFLFKLVGVHSWIAPVILTILGACSAGLTMFISGKVIKGRSALLPGLVFVSMPFASDLDATHHWFSTAFAMAALAVTIEKRTPFRLASAGILIAIATFFTQSACLLAAGLAVFLLWEERIEARPWMALAKKEAALLGPFLVSLAGCLSYFVYAAGIKRFLYWTVVFVAKYYPAEWVNTWRVYLAAWPGIHRSGLVNIPAFILIHLVVPFIYVLALVPYTWRSGTPNDKPRKEIAFLSVAGLFLFLSVASAPAAVRLYAVSAPALILLVWFLDSREGWRQGLKLLWAMVLFLAIARPVVAQLSNKGSLNLPTGRTAFLSRSAYEQCSWMSGRTHPLDYFFGDPMLAFAFRLRNASRVPSLTPTDYTRPEEVQDTVEGLERFQVRFVSWPGWLNDDREFAEHPEGNHLAPLRLYLRKHYHLAVTFSDGDQIWERDE